MDNGPDRELGKLEDLSKATPAMIFKGSKKLIQAVTWLVRKVIKARQTKIEELRKSAEREVIDEISAKIDDKKLLEKTFRKEPELKEYLTPEPQSMTSKLWGKLSGKSQEKTITHPRELSKAAWKFKHNLLKRLISLDKTVKIEEIVKNNPQLSVLLENPKKPKDMPLKAVDTDRNVEQRRPSKAVDTNLNMSNNQPLDKEVKQSRFSDRVQHAKQKSALQNEELRRGNKARELGLGSTVTKSGMKPPIKRLNTPNVSFGR